MRFHMNLNIRMIFAITALLFSASASATSGTVVAKCKGWMLVETQRGYSLIEYSSGQEPERGDQIAGDLERYGMKAMHNTSQDRGFRVYVDGWGLNREWALKRINEKCR